MPERSAEDVATGILRIPIEGTVKAVPTLKAKYVPAWSELLDSPAAPDQPISEWLLDRVTAYDRTGALGGREWLEEHADPSELHGALLAMVGNAFPLGDAPTLVTLAVVSSAVQPNPPSSTNSASTNGGSTPTISDHDSTRSR